ncbi:rab GTPase-binding effector protein 1 [Trichonephila clavipes]|nr:rab GTPase-binding effector protein 1 [Trichonephila clavipes]
MVLKANDRRTSAPCPDEFHGPRSDSSVLPNFEGEHPETGQKLSTSLPLPPSSRDDLRLNSYLEYPHAAKRILFSDEAHFWLNGYVNKQNCRIWSEANPQVYVETPLHPEKLTVCCALWAGGIIGPYFFKNDEGHNVTVNGDRYRAMITNFFIPELNNHDVQELWLQQDGATCLIQVNEFPEPSASDIQHLQKELRRLQSELDECRSLVTVAECEKENVVETEERKRKEEVASIQRIMEEAVSEAVRNTSSRYEKELSQLQKTNEKLESDLQELKNKDKTDISREGVLAAVTKSLKRVGNLGGPLPFTSSTGESIENLEESMRKAQEDAEMLRSLVVPLEEEIKALKDKLRSTDEQLREYETAFANLVKGLGSDSLSEMIKGKGPAEVVKHLDEKLISLSQGLQAEKASRSDLEMYVAVLNTREAAWQADMDKLRLELQEVCQLLEKEKKEHVQLKRTWQMANDQFLEAQRLQIMDMSRMQSVLTSEQQRQIAEAKKRDERRMELERQMKSMERKEDSEEKVNEEKGRTSPFSRPSSAKLVKSSPVMNHKLLVNSNKLSQDLDSQINSSTRARSIPDNLNLTENVLTEKRSLSSSALNGMSKDNLKNSSLVPINSPPVKEAQMTPTTPKKVPSLTQDQLKALSDLTPELEIRKSLLDNARAELESCSLIGKRLVSEKAWQELEEELKRAREKLGQSCEMCCNYELQLQHVQQMESEQRSKAAAAEQKLEDYKKDLHREQEYRQEMKEKFDEISKECEQKVSELFKMREEFEKTYNLIKNNYDICRKELTDYQTLVAAERDTLKRELERVQNENDVLLGKHIAKAQQMRNEDINLPDTTEELQFYCLQKQEELITIKAAKENMEEALKGDIQMLKNQLTSEQNAKERLEDTYTQELDNLREQLGILESVQQELSLQQTQNSDLDKRLTCLLDDLKARDDKISQLHAQVEELLAAKSKLEEEVHELKSKVQGLQSDLDNSEAVQRDFVKLSQSLQMELEKIRQSDSEVRWQHDEDVPECNTCKKTFQSRKEKFHCNHCGKIFCFECSSRTVNSGPKKRQFKVCNVCHTLLDHQTAPYFSSDPPQTPS